MSSGRSHAQRLTRGNPSNVAVRETRECEPTTTAEASSNSRQVIERVERTAGRLSTHEFTPFSQVWQFCRPFLPPPHRLTLFFTAHETAPYSAREDGVLTATARALTSCTGERA